jgi:hypothetical protein
VSGFAVLAVKEVAVASGLSTSLLPGIAPSAIDGFAAGTLLSALCVLLVMAPRRGLRRRRARARAAARTVAAHNPMTPDLSRNAARPARFVPVARSNPLADESAEVLISRVERRPEAKRSSGRHAAPPVGVGSRVASRLAPAARD